MCLAPPGRRLRMVGGAGGEGQGQGGGDGEGAYLHGEGAYLHGEGAPLLGDGERRPLLDDGERTPLLGTRTHSESSSSSWSCPGAGGSLGQRVVALSLLCLLGAGSFFCFDNPAALQGQIREVLQVRGESRKAASLEKQKFNKEVQG